VCSRDNVTTFFGLDDTSRIVDPLARAHVFEWLPALSFDDQGNCVVYDYKPEDLVAVPGTRAEANRRSGVAPFANLHLKKIRYGNRVPYAVDETALTEVFAHLVANAAEATLGQNKPRITLAVKPIREGEHASGVIVTVQDNGKGIAPELQEKVFSPFCTTKARGMGLGLPIVKRTVFDHNGRVDIDSNPHGTSVSVMLPASPNGH